MQRLKGKVAIVTGAGQTPGTTIGNGRATAILFAREGAKVMLVDRDHESATEPLQMIEALLPIFHRWQPGRPPPW